MSGCWETTPDGRKKWVPAIAAMAPIKAVTTAAGYKSPDAGAGPKMEPAMAASPIGSCDARLSGLPQRGKIMAEYVWLGGAETTGGFDIRSKSRTLDKAPKSPSDLPIWNFDGSSTGQAPGEDSEVMIKPVAIYPDPFRGEPNIMVLCECLDPKLNPIPTNTRNSAAARFAKNTASEPWFGIEQEYTLFEKDGVTPLGWPVGGEPKPQGPYYCSAGYDVSYGRNVMETHYRVCLYAGLNISGTNAEVMPGQWEYQIGPCTGIAAGDEMWISRWLMIRVCELLEVNVSFDPKPIPGDWNGAGCHTNYSTVGTRKPGGYKEIIKMVEKLGPKHAEHIAMYGEGNERRLTGRHETASISDYSYGVANRGASIRIPRQAEAEGCGYFEDRRPASNMDPYVVTAKIFQTTVLE
jgi:glutamine synthetase